MRKSDIPVVVSASLFNPLVEIRSFRWGRVVASEEEGHYVLIVQEHGSPQHTLYEYDNPQEFHDDLTRVVHFPGGDGGSQDTGVPAPIVPSPPVRMAGAEEPIPEEQ